MGVGMIDMAEKEVGLCAKKIKVETGGVSHFSEDPGKWRRHVGIKKHIFYLSLYLNSIIIFFPTLFFTIILRAHHVYN